MKNYLEIAYQESEKPFGEYPLQLARYLMCLFDLRQGMRILDNGCGRGEFLHAFSRFGMEAYGTDISNYCKDAQVVDLNTGALPFPDDYFDAVFSKSVIEHIENTDQYMKEMRRVLKWGGVLIVMVPDWETQYRIFYQDPTHIHPYMQKSLERLLQMYKFEKISVNKFVQLPSVWTSRSAAFISRIVRIAGPVKKIHKNKFIRFSRELMILGSGKKK